jgi:hypothetical protein
VDRVAVVVDVESHTGNALFLGSSISLLPQCHKRLRLSSLFLLIKVRGVNKSLPYC